MRTKFHIITGGTSHEVPNTDIKNWDEIKYTLERKDFSGVMRYFSTEFAFVGETFALLLDLYMADGFLAVAEVAVSTKNNDWTYTEQFRCPLDFSSLKIENGILTINAIDNTLASLLKSKKGQKYEFPMSQFEISSVMIERMAFANCAKYDLPNPSNAAGIVDARVDNSASTIISTEYVEPSDASSGYDGTSEQRHFASIKGYGVTLNISVQATVRCYLNPNYGAVANPEDGIAEMALGYWDGTLSVPRFVRKAVLFDNDISKKRINGIIRNLWVGKLNHRNYATLDALKSEAENSSDGIFTGTFGVVGSATYPNESYWTDNEVYEYTGFGTWAPMGPPAFYYKDRFSSGSYALTGLEPDQHFPMLQLTYGMIYTAATMTMTWTDPARHSYAYNGIKPLHLLNAIVTSISPTATVSIADDAAGLLAKTFIFPAEALRQMAGAKVYSTFQQFADWMGAVFGYTYRVVGNEVQFLPRSDVFADGDVKVIAEAKSIKYAVDTNLIYSEVDAGYSKKEYGEINGRLETNFTNYYATGYNANDRKLSLISKYRADAYGIEFTLRKGEKSGDTTDDKNDEDVFFASAVEDDGSLKYAVGDNVAYAPAVCVANNAGYIAAMGNGAAVVLTMTSSDGNNALADITIPAGTALFTAGRLSFVTDDMIDPVSLDGLIEVERDGFRIRGYISKAEARFGRQNGMEYELIIKDITKL